MSTPASAAAPLWSTEVVDLTRGPTGRTDRVNVLRRSHVDAPKRRPRGSAGSGHGWPSSSLQSRRSWTWRWGPTALSLFWITLLCAIWLAAIYVTRSTPARDSTFNSARRCRPSSAPTLPRLAHHRRQVRTGPHRTFTAVISVARLRLSVWAYAPLVSETALRAITWVLAFLPVALFTAIVFDRMSDTLPIGSATRWFFIVGLLALTALAGGDHSSCPPGRLDRRRRTGRTAE